jgi:hypothetical protein
MDVNKAGLYIGLLALFLAIPLSVVANLITPRLRDWYSTRSVIKLTRRILQLEEKLRKARQEWTFNPADLKIWESSINSESKISALLYVVLLGMCGATVISRWYFNVWRYATVDRVLYVLVLVFWAGWILFYFFGWMGVVFENRETYTMHTEDGREALRQRIEKLRSKLES